MKRKNLSQRSGRWMLVAALLCCGALSGYAVEAAQPAPQSQQAATVTQTGTVVDNFGEPVIGAAVTPKGTSNGVNTNIDGEFSIKVPVGTVLTVSCVGYVPVEAVVTGQPLKVTLKEDSQILDDVVVIGYGTQKKADVTSAVSSVKAEDFNMGRIGDAAELVKGKVAGLSVVNSSGNPTSSSSIMLRGVTTVMGSLTPLILIDGIEGDLDTVAPENIAEIDVLKDASAAAIYGTRGANGVILITTKSGRREQKAVASYSNYFAFGKWSKKPDLMDTHDVINGLTTQTYEGYDTDWIDAISRKASFKHNHSFQVSGGGANSTYSAYVTYMKDEGMIINTDNESLKMQMDYTQYLWNDIIKVNFNSLISRQKYSAANGNADFAFRQAMVHNPSEPVYNEDGSYYENFSKYQYYNPVEILNEVEGNTRVRFWQMVGNITVEPIKGWRTNVMLSWNETNSTSETWTSPRYWSLAQQNDYNGYASKGEGNSTSKSIEVTSNYNKNFNRVHRFDAMVGYSYLYNQYDGFGAGNGNFSTEVYKYNNLGNGTFLTEEDRHASVSSYRNDNKLVGFFGRISYGYDNRYNILVSLRHEGSSKFGANNKWATFPSVSLGWNIMNEQFMKSTSAWLNNLRLRVGYGKTGVIPSDSYISLYKYAYDNYGDIMNMEGDWIKSLKVSQNMNKDLKWETTHEWNFGVDYGFFNDRLSGAIDFYIKQTNDLLYDYAVPVPPNLYDVTTANVGKIRNTGIEFMVTGIPVQTKDFQWTTTVTLSHNKNKLLSLENDLYETDNFVELGDAGDPISTPTHYMEVGTGFGDFWGLKFAGYDKDGYALVEVKNQTTGEWELQPFSTDLNVITNRQKLGNGMPSVYFGWSNQFYYKGFDLSMQFTGQFGFDILNLSRAHYESKSKGYNCFKSAGDWHPAINLDRTPVLDADGNQVYVRSASSLNPGFWSDHIEKGDFFKLTNLNIGYTIPFKGAVTKYIEKLRIYGSATNLFCITSYSGLDPEVSNYFRTPGVDGREKYPTIRTYTVGMQLTF